MLDYQELEKLKSDMRVYDRKMRKYSRSIIIISALSLILIFLLLTPFFDVMLKDLENELRPYSDSDIYLLIFLEGFLAYGGYIITALWVILFIIHMAFMSRAFDKYTHLSRQFYEGENTLRQSLSPAARQWTCKCGRKLGKNISSCVCGISQRELREQISLQEN